jgi:hypothetical protein
MTASPGRARNLGPRLASWPRGVLWGGLLAGVLDIGAAFATSALAGRGPVRVLHAVASGLLGAEAFRGGAPAAALGLGLHFVIALGAAAVYGAASRLFPALVRRAVPAGLLYGVAVYFFMNLVVLPLSAVPFKVAFTPAGLAQGLLIHMTCVGLPIALCARRYAG